jgi:hypothetical protein
VGYSVEEVLKRKKKKSFQLDAMKKNIKKKKKEKKIFSAGYNEKEY